MRSRTLPNARPSKRQRDSLPRIFPRVLTVDPEIKNRDHTFDQSVASSIPRTGSERKPHSFFGRGIRGKRFQSRVDRRLAEPPRFEHFPLCIDSLLLKRDYGFARVRNLSIGLQRGDQVLFCFRESSTDLLREAKILERPSKSDPFLFF